MVLSTANNNQNRPCISHIICYAVAILLMKVRLRFNLARYISTLRCRQSACVHESKQRTIKDRDELLACFWQRLCEKCSQIKFKDERT